MVADQPAGEADQDRRQGHGHGRYVAFQMAEIAVPRQMFVDILSLIARLRGTARPSMTSSEVRCGQITRGEVCLGASKAVRFSASVQSTARFDPLLPAPGGICHCPPRSEARSQNRRDLANVG